MSDISTLNGYNLKDAQARSDISTLNNKIGSANGIAELDSNGRVPSSQLPSYVDDVLEYASQSAFPATGESGKIYIALDTNKTFRWSGSAYVEISESLALGETSSTAYAGNKGKANADAITAMKDGSSIDSFGDVETALAGKADKFGVDGSTIDWLAGVGIPDKLYVMEHDEIPQEGTESSGLPNDEAIRKAVKSAYDLTKDTVGWNGKNLLGYKVGKSYNASGVMVDSTHGVISAIIPVSTGDKFIASKKTAISSADSNMMARQFDSNGAFVSSVKALDKADLSGVYTVPSGIAYVGFVQFYNDGTITEDIVNTYEMMLRKADILDPTYEPYRGTTAFPRDEQAVLGAKNLLPVENFQGDINGIAYNIADGIVNMSGISTAATGRVFGNFTFKGGVTYYLSGNPSNDADIWIGVYNTSTTRYEYVQSTNTSNVVAIKYDEDTTRRINIRVGSGETVTNLQMKPMIALSSDEIFAPYAMTNRELTEKVNKNTVPTTMEDLLANVPKVGDSVTCLLGSATHIMQTLTGGTYDKSGKITLICTASGKYEWWGIIGAGEYFAYGKIDTTTTPANYSFKALTDAS